jgi:hypothetical protein
MIYKIPDTPRKQLKSTPTNINTLIKVVMTPDRLPTIKFYNQQTNHQDTLDDESEAGDIFVGVRRRPVTRYFIGNIDKISTITGIRKHFKRC